MKDKIIAETGIHYNGQLMYEHPMLNGRYHGILKGWHDNGNISYIWPCLNGQLQGMCQEWNKNGTRVLIRQYKNHNQHGPIIEFKYEY